MDQIRIIPSEILNIIPKYDGDQKLLSLFLKKSEYVIDAFRSEENPAQDLYIFHSITGRLVGKAAHLISERNDIGTWLELKQALTQHFGEHRSIECIAVELENLKIGQNESYLNFCNRIQTVRSTLFAKLNMIEDEAVKQAKMHIYDDISLKVFLYNLPEDLIRIVRLRTPGKLEDALTIVMEEVDFIDQYHSRNKSRHSSQVKSTLNVTPQMPNIKPIFPQNNYGQNFRFIQPQHLRNNGFPQNQNFKFGIPNQIPPQGFKFGIPQNQGLRSAPNQTNFKFGIPRQQIGYRPFLPSNNQYNNMQPQFRFNNPPPYQQPQPRPQQSSFRFDNDVSMRTAPPLRPNPMAPRMPNNLLYANELYDSEYYEPENYYMPENDFSYQYQEVSGDYFENYDNMVDQAPSGHQDQSLAENTENENFQLQASMKPPPK